MLCCDWFVFNGCDGHILILIFSVICSLGGPLSHGSSALIDYLASSFIPRHQKILEIVLTEDESSGEESESSSTDDYDLELLCFKWFSARDSSVPTLTIRT